MLKYDVEKIKFSDLKGKIEIPKFQRGLVWSTTKKKEFIKTLKSGLPIGVLLLSKSKSGDKYLIVDGLQRYTTMYDYSKDYFKYIEESEISDTDLMSIIVSSHEAHTHYDAYADNGKKLALNDMRKIVARNISNGYGKNATQISKDIASQLCKDVAIFPSDAAFYMLDPVSVIVDKIQKNANIDDIQIPLIIFKGSEDELANIFQKLNQEGVKLSKYDVFAATWISHTVTIKDDPKFVDLIINKYEAAQKQSELDIAMYDPDEMKQKGELTVFEYAFAVGKALMNKCEKLFPKVNESKVDSIGFLILAELLGLTYQEMGKLAETMTSYKNLDYKKLKDAIVESGSIVESMLGSYIESPTTPKTGKGKTSLVCHSELQLASYIIVVFKLKYEISKNNGLTSKNLNKELKKVREFIHKHYLYDIIRGHWAGSGDSKLEEIIADPTTCRYVKDVDKDDLERVISAWLSEGNAKSSLINVSAETKLFLNYLLRTSKAYDCNHGYDVEHCVPKDVIKKYYTNKRIVVPMSSPCNLVFIPSADNRSKGELTYYQRQAHDPGTYKLDEQQLIELGYPTKTDLQFVNSASGLTEDNYFKYLNHRKNDIVHKFINALYPTT